MSKLANLLIETLAQDDETAFFGNKELQRDVDDVCKLTLERLCYIARLYHWKLAMSNNGTDWYSYGEKPHEFVKTVAFSFYERFDDERDSRKLITQLLLIGLPASFMKLHVQHKVSPLVEDFEKLADFMGFQFKFVKRDEDDFRKDKENDE